MLEKEVCMPVGDCLCEPLWAGTVQYIWCSSASAHARSQNVAPFHNALMHLHSYLNMAWIRKGLFLKHGKAMCGSPIVLELQLQLPSAIQLYPVSIWRKGKLQPHHIKRATRSPSLLWKNKQILGSAFKQFIRDGETKGPITIQNTNFGDRLFHLFLYISTSITQKVLCDFSFVSSSYISVKHAAVHIQSELMRESWDYNL